MSRAFYLIAVLALALAAGAAHAQEDDIRFRSGNIKVRHGTSVLEDAEGKQTVLPFNQIQRDSIVFGFCFDDAKYRRMPATYYHPRGPAGVALQQFNWLPGPANTYDADARLAVSLVGQAADLGMAGVPVGLLETLWSEPPVAVIGMEAGTLASYARPFQHFDFYEADKQVVDLNLRTGKDSFFHFIPDARARGAQIGIFEGPPRRQLRERGPRKFYKLMILEACTGEDREKIALDFFTREGIAQCFENLTDDGILCVHTSHRFVNLPRVLFAIGEELKLAMRRGLDMESDYSRPDRQLKNIGHWTSEWVLMCRNENVLDRVCKAPPDYMERSEYWGFVPPRQPVWTDKGPNLLHGLLHGHPAMMTYEELAGPVCDFLKDAANEVGLKNHRTTQTFIINMRRMPRELEDLFVQYQLARSPRVETLWR